MMNGILVRLVIVFCCVAVMKAVANSSDFRDAQKRSIQQHTYGNCNECGLNFGKSVLYTIDGTPVKIAKHFPWMVGLIKTESSSLFCGGALISNEFVLTAAHCLLSEGNIIHLEQLRVGFLTPSEHVGIRPAVVEVAETFIHRNFLLRMEIEHDIALIRLKIPIRCSDFINPICLPPRNLVVPHDTMLITTGWEKETSSGINSTQEMRWSSPIRVAHKDKCHSVGLQDVVEEYFCMRSGGEQSPCYGDSGGSMFAQINGKYYTIGVTSVHSSPLCETTSPVVFSSVRAHLDWINKAMSISRIP